jgi:hypothetical protein
LNLNKIGESIMFRILLAFLALVLTPQVVYGQSTIANLPITTNLNGQELFPVVQNGITRRASLNQALALLLVNSNTWTAAQLIRQPITFGCGSPASIPCDNASSADVINLINGMDIKWANISGNRQFSISVKPGTSNGGTLQYSDQGLVIHNSAGSSIHQFYQAGNHVNGVYLGGSVTGSPAQIYPRGTDTTIGLTIAPKGSAPVTINNLRLNPVAFGALPTCSPTSLGYIAFITDAAVPVSAWNQPVTAGGGANKAFIKCNGSGWFAF